MAGARRYWWIWLPVAAVAAWAFIRLLGLDGGTDELAPLMAFTPYAAIAALLAAGLALALRNWAAALAALAASACLAAAVLPRVIGDGTVSAAGHETLRIYSANVHRGTTDPEQLVAAVRRWHPDLLALQELTPHFAQRLRAAGLERWLPHADLAFDRRAARLPGLGTYSRLPLRPYGPTGTRLLAVVAHTDGGRAARVVNVHPHTPKPGHLGSWSDTLERMPSAGAGTPLVLVGDFNATLDQVELRDVVSRGYRDAASVAGKGLEPTYPQDQALPALVTIDHVLADRRLGIVAFDVVAQPGSDHRAIRAILALP